MVRYCLVPGCKSKSQAGHEGISVHLPKNQAQAKKWVLACKRDDPVNMNNSGVCSLHFKPDDFARDLRYELLNPDKRANDNRTKKLKEDAIPSQNIPTRTAKG